MKIGWCVILAALAPAAGAGQATSSVQGASSLSAAGNLASPGTSVPPRAPLPVPSRAPLPTPGVSSVLGAPGGPTIAGARASTGGIAVPSPVGPRLLQERPVAAGQGDVPVAQLPGAGEDPLAPDLVNDPVLRFANNAAPAERFRSLVARAVEDHSAVAAAEAAASEANAVVSQARSGRFPTIDLSITGDRSLSRDFSIDDNAVIERARPHGRTDANATVSETLLDFGGTTRRIRAARARLDAANADISSAAEDTATQAISAWYDLAAYRTLVSMALVLQASEDEITGAVNQRIRQGVAAQSDLARVQTYTSAADARLAQYRRALASAEARYTEVIGEPPPQRVDRPVLAVDLPRTIEEARTASRRMGQVRSAEAQARAAHEDYRAAVSDNLPRVQAVIDAGRYGVFEDRRDYDVRGRLVLQHRLVGGGGDARRRQAAAREQQVRATADRTAEEAERDAVITFTDVAASEDEVAALQAAYVANRKSRDVLVERFRFSQGNLIDVLNAEDAYFQVAAQYIQAVVRRDAQRLVLAQRGGTLLPALGVQIREQGR